MTAVLFHKKLCIALPFHVSVNTVLFLVVVFKKIDIKSMGLINKKTLSCTIVMTLSQMYSYIDISTV